MGINRFSECGSLRERSGLAHYCAPREVTYGAANTHDLGWRCPWSSIWYLDFYCNSHWLTKSNNPSAVRFLRRLAIDVTEHDVPEDGEQVPALSRCVSRLDGLETAEGMA